MHPLQSTTICLTQRQVQRLERQNEPGRTDVNANVATSNWDIITDKSSENSNQREKAAEGMESLSRTLQWNPRPWPSRAMEH